MAVATQGTTDDRAPRAEHAVLWAGLVLFYLAVRIPLLAVPLERDEGLFGVMGQAILRGEVPYRDVFEHKPPGVFYVYALGLLLVPPTTIGVHAFLALWNFATALVVASLAAAIGGARAGPGAVLLFIIASAAPSVQGFSASTEMLLLLPLVASVRLALAALARAGTGRALYLVGSGALFAATFWIKQPAVVAAAAAPLAIVVEQRHDLRRATRDLVPWVGGTLAVTLVATLPFVLLGGGREFWYWTFTHSWLYGQLPVSHWIGRLGERLINLSRDLGVPLLLAVTGAVLGLRERRPHAWLVPVFFALSMVSALQSRFFYTHYFALFAPATAVAGGIALARLWESADPRRRTVALVAAALAVGLPVVACPWYWLRPDPAEVSRRVLGLQGFEAAPLVADYVRAHMSPDDRLFIYGSEPEVPFLAERRDVNPFGMVYPLTWTWPRHREFQERVWRNIERARPAYILLPRTTYTLVRSPDIDTFFEEHLVALGRQAYQIETVLLVEPNGDLRFAPAPSEVSRGEPEPQVLYEIWRRRPDADEAPG